MKTTLLIACIFCVSTAFGQSATVLSGEAYQLEFPSHVQHASQHALAPEQSNLPAPAFTYGKGERPLWEFASAVEEKPLGDTARALKAEHVADKKSDVVWVN